MELTNISTIKELMARHGISFTKSLGQNFLTNPTVCPRIAQEGGVDENTAVLEIGPGIGVLTKELALRAKKVVAIELDKGLLPVLSETLEEFSNVKIIQGDILKINLPELFREEFEGMDVVVCANLPYYITSPIIMGLLEQNLPIRSITVMVQKEAAERIAAPIPSREMGSITVAIAYWASTTILFPVSRGSFLPAPNVDSSVIRLDLYDTPPVSVLEEADFFAFVRASFAQRRKTIANSVSSTLELEKAVVNEMLAATQLAGNIRAEQLTLEQFAALSNEYTKYKEKQER